MKLLDLVRGEQALTTLAQQPMSPSTAFRLGVVMRQAAPYLEQFKKQRLELAQEYSGKQDDITLLDDIPEEKRQEFVDKLAAILEEDVPVVFTKIKVDSIDGRMSPADMLTLEWLFDDV